MDQPLDNKETTTPPQQSQQTQQGPQSQQITQPPQTQPVTTPPKSNKAGLYLSIILIIFVVFSGIYLMLQKPTTNPKSNQQTLQRTSSPTPIMQPTTTVSPVTTSNVDSTLDKTDTSIQQSIDNANADLDSINNIDNSQDSTSGL